MPVFQVTISDTDERLVCEQGQSVLNAMEQLSRKGIPVGCRGGGCGVCRVRVLQGEYETKRMSCEHVSAEEAAEGLALACRLYPLTDLVVAVEGKLTKAVMDRSQDSVTQFWQQQKNRTVLGR